MDQTSEDMKQRLALFADSLGLRLGVPLGHGKDGIVVSTLGPAHERTAIKSLARADLYIREKECYIRLDELGVSRTRVCGHAVPQLLNYDDQLWTLEMTMVARPYVLDFATAYLNDPPEFPPEVIEERLAHWAEAFEENWPHAQRIIAQFRRMGIHLLDPSPSNIGFVVTTRK